MKRKHAYRASAIAEVRLGEVSAALVAGCIAGLDVAKTKFVCALATVGGAAVKLFQFEHPRQTRMFLELLEKLKVQLGTAGLRVAMEPTGTYGDAIRYQLARRNVEVVMVQPKKTHDSQEICDGVPSLHDGKSATLLAWLCAVTETRTWQAPDEKRTELRALVEARRHYAEYEQVCLGRLEALLARHWPELEDTLSPRLTSGVVLLGQYPSPGTVMGDVEGARGLLQRVSRRKLSEEKIEELLRGASESLGVPATAAEGRYIQQLAQESERARQEQKALEEQMGASTHEVFVRLRDWMGTYTAAVIVALCDPTQYEHVDEFMKACGLNLKEKSSGKYKGQLKLTKRGPGAVRHVLYLFTLRMIAADVQVRAWYEPHIKNEKQKMKAIIATMRKLAAGVFHVARGNPFEPGRLFNLKPQPATQRAPAPQARSSHQPDPAQASKEALPWSKHLPGAATAPA